MSATSSPTEGVRRLTVTDIGRMYADGERIAMLTAYDYPTAKLLDEAGIPMLLVGDSLGRASWATRTSCSVTMADMLHHAAAVTRGARRALVIGDMPFLTYTTPEDALAQRRPVHPRRRRPGGQGRGRRPQRPDHRDARQGRHPGHGPHRADAPVGERDRQVPRPGQDRRPGPGAAPRRARGPGGRARSRSSSSSCRSSSPPRSRSGSGSRRSGSGRGRAAAARSRSSPTSSASTPGSRSTRSSTRTSTRRSSTPPGRTPERSPPGRSPARSRPSGWTTPCSTRCWAGRSRTPPPASVPIGGIPLDRDL